MEKAKDDLEKRVDMVLRQIDMMATAVEDQWAALRFIGHFCPDGESIFGEHVPPVVWEGVLAVLKLVEAQSLLIRNEVIPVMEDEVMGLGEVVTLELERVKRSLRPRTVE